MQSRLTAWSVAAVLSCSSLAMAQSTLDHPTGEFVGYPLDTGKLDNPGDTVRPVFSQVVNVKNVAWLRLYFSDVQLAPGSYIEVTSFQDGETQRLDRDGLQMWSDTTAYFNGDSVLFEVHAAPHTQGNRIVMTQLGAEPMIVPRGAPGQCGICGADDRTPSNELWSGRLMPVGCTASIFCEDSGLVSAGHCISGQLVMQFNVPNSQANCNTTNPPVADQFPIVQTSFVNGGVGNDWSVLRTGNNNLGQSAFTRQNAVRHFTTVLANPGQAAQIFGFGVDTTCTRSQTQQLSPGSISSRTSNTYRYSNDVRGGNSGSGFIVNDFIVGIVTHCNTACTNIATRQDVPAFITARNSLGLCDNTYTIDIQSSGASGIPITVSPSDVNNAGAGLTNFSRVYSHFTSVTFTAPETFGNSCFVQWTLNGAPVSGNVLTFTVTGAATAIAEYRNCGCPCDWNKNGTLNSQDFFDFLQDFFKNNADYNNDQTTNSQDFFDFLTCFFEGC